MAAAPLLNGVESIKPPGCSALILCTMTGRRAPIPEAAEKRAAMEKTAAGTQERA
jgi:hypothetical protein